MLRLRTSVKGRGDKAPGQKDPPRLVMHDTIRCVDMHGQDEEQFFHSAQEYTNVHEPRDAK